jgi:hypothetical protein
MAGHRNRCRTARRRARRTSVAVAVVVLALGGCARDTSTAAGSTASVIDLYEGGVWRRVPHDEAVFGGDGYQSMLAITAGGPGLVAVGYEAIGGDSDAAVWTSPDGVTWSQVPHDEAVFGGEGPQKMLAVVAGGPGLVAVGHDFADGDGDAAVWTSEDGMIWTRVCQETEVFGGDSYQMMTAVAVGGPGLVAVGRDVCGRPDLVAGCPRRGRVWWRHAVPDDRDHRRRSRFGGCGVRMPARFLESGCRYACGPLQSWGELDCGGMGFPRWSRLDAGAL